MARWMFCPECGARGVALFTPPREPVLDCDHSSAPRRFRKYGIGYAIAIGRDRGLG